MLQEQLFSSLLLLQWGASSPSPLHLFADNFDLLDFAFTGDVERLKQSQEILMGGQIISVRLGHDIIIWYS